MVPSSLSGRVWTVECSAVADRPLRSRRAGLKQKLSKCLSQTSKCRFAELEFYFSPIPMLCRYCYSLPLGPFDSSSWYSFKHGLSTSFWAHCLSMIDSLLYCLLKLGLFPAADKVLRITASLVELIQKKCIKGTK